MAQTKKSTKSAVGAPSQHSQSSRKGKRAWRKNVNIDDVEAAMEDIRTEERVTGTALHKKTDAELFHIDLTGDDKAVRKSLPKPSTLTSLRILSERSAIPAVGSRKRSVSRDAKDRLLRIAKRPRKGPFNSIIDPTEAGAGSAMLGLSEAVKNSGNYDPWAPQPPQEEIKDGMETVMKKVIKAPVHKDPRHAIDAPAIAEPHQGTSYNPPVNAHQELLLKAHEIEEKRVNDAAKMAEFKAKIDSAWHVPQDPPGVPPGMRVDVVPAQDLDEEEEEVIAKPMPERKTKQQRRKAARVLAEKRALAEKTAKKRMHSTINDAKSLHRQTNKILSLREKATAQRKQAMEDKLRKGLAGQKLGKHKVPEGEVDVQLGEDLSENLRGLKPEGNLFRDRFLSLQQRALVEPRVRVIPTRRRRGIVEYEKHAWKNFE
ncbi:ribosome biogenesis protein Nop53/GLTSCR2 [Mycena floridula]|nr:ribosome biogenesis protein Nop53/GLTSCR2 [Mycena floridula]